MKNDRGFSLLEAVVALVIVGLVAIAGLAAVGAELRGAARVKRASEASSLAEYRLERLRLLSREELEHLPDSVSRGTFEDPFSGYHWTSASARVAGERDLFDLDVQVSWSDGEYHLATNLYRRSPQLTLRQPESQ